MKSLFILIFFILFSHSSLATNLCDTSCKLSISFPTGGTIEATEALTFTFGIDGALDLGETGTINTAIQISSTEFSAGDQLTLSKDESISFDAGGSLNLSVGGNLDYSNITIISDGVVILAVDVIKALNLNNISFIGTGSLVVTVTTIETNGSLLEGGDLFINTPAVIDVDSTQDTCLTSSSSSVTMTTGRFEPVVIETEVLCNTLIVDAGITSASIINGAVIAGPLPVEGVIVDAGITSASNINSAVAVGTLSVESVIIHTANDNLLNTIIEPPLTPKIDEPLDLETTESNSGGALNTITLLFFFLSMYFFRPDNKV